MHILIPMTGSSVCPKAFEQIAEKSYRAVSGPDHICAKKVSVSVTIFFDHGEQRQLVLTLEADDEAFGEVVVVENNLHGFAPLIVNG
jgi:hypothetical protein